MFGLFKKKQPVTPVVTPVTLPARQPSTKATPRSDQLMKLLREEGTLTAQEIMSKMNYKNIHSALMLVRTNEAKITSEMIDGVRYYRRKYSRKPAAAKPAKELKKAKKYRYAFEDPAIRAKAVAALKAKAAKRKQPAPEADPLDKPEPFVPTALPGVPKPSAFRVTTDCKTSNLALAAALYTKGHKLKDTKIDGKNNASFIFEHSADFVFDANKFWNRTLVVDAHTYHENIKLLRSKIVNM